MNDKIYRYTKNQTSHRQNKKDYLHLTIKSIDIHNTRPAIDDVCAYQEVATTSGPSKHANSLFNSVFL